MPPRRGSRKRGNYYQKTRNLKQSDKSIGISENFITTEKSENCEMENNAEIIVELNNKSEPAEINDSFEDNLIESNIDNENNSINNDESDEVLSSEYLENTIDFNVSSDAQAIQENLKLENSNLENDIKSENQEVNKNKNCEFQNTNDSLSNQNFDCNSINKENTNLNEKLYVNPVSKEKNQTLKESTEPKNYEGIKEQSVILKQKFDVCEKTQEEQYPQNYESQTLQVKQELDDCKKKDDNFDIENNLVNESDNISPDLPYQVKISHLPANYIPLDFQKHIQNTFKVEIQKIISPAKNSPWVIIPFATKEEQENIVRLLHNHIWKKKALRAIAIYPTNILKRKIEASEGSENKKPKLDEVPVLTLEEEILSESLPLYSVPYEEQNRLSIVDVEILSNKLHAFMCVRNPALAGWAESMCLKNNNSIFKIEPLKSSPILEGYRNKCKFRVGKNIEGKTTVGFCLNDNENKILGVQPGDKLIHLPDSMKYAAKKFEDFIQTSGKEPFVKKQKSGFWDHIIIRIVPEGSLMLVVVMYHNNLSDENITEIKNEVREYFVNGEGRDCKLYSLYFQIMYDKAPVLPADKLELLHGETHFLENICGLKFYVGPFSILNVNSSSSENIYNSIIELADPTPETTILDLCSGTGGIAFTIANKCKNVIAIESHSDHISDAFKTKELNNIQNVEFIKGKVEDELGRVFDKLGDVPIIPVIDPPRQGLVQKAISQLRANQNIKKLVYVCSNSKMGAKNFLDLCAAADRKEGTFGNPLNVIFSGLPFLPVRAIPIDVAPFTVNNTIIILFERINPSTFPKAQKPPPQPIKRPQLHKDENKKKKNISKKMSRNRGKTSSNENPGNKARNSNNSSRNEAIVKNLNKDKEGKKNSKNGEGNSSSRSRRRGRRHRYYYRKQSHTGENQSGKFPPPLLRHMDPALSLVERYERRIAELEQQDRAFKAGLTLGLQALGTQGPHRGGNGNFDGVNNNFNFSGNGNFDEFRTHFSRERNYENAMWRSERSYDNMGGYGGNHIGNRYTAGAFNNYDNFGNFGNFGGYNNFGDNENNYNTSYNIGAGNGYYRNYQGYKFRR